MKHLPIQALDDIRRFSVFFGRFRNFGTAVERPEDPTPLQRNWAYGFCEGTDEKSLIFIVSWTIFEFPEQRPA